MARAKQLRSLKTRERLIGCAREIVSVSGFEKLRVEDVVSAAAVAKGTFFTHFRDKDALMDILIAERIDVLLNDLESSHNFSSVEHVVTSIMPFLSFISSERYVFDVFLRLSGALAVEEIGKIAESIYRYDRILIEKLKGSPFRQDISEGLLSEGIQAFSVSSVALSLCALHSDQNVKNRLTIQLNAWLLRPS
ncbi:TetR family transcriptional regulator [Sulfitobacter sp. M220]|uniref:TetR/AcrR family transcriptional regulator n=1 Tax=Sulfitobacter sp. M220 TaxID=2675333 RepID=UPI001F3D065B|nr:TetR/AcrR family transcriptional regulator [Sulfitobacter sp. M220]MCF7779100.1 TetR family transcriptional regulator [Sulfitobacter sp. M220]|tara:strand:+ start:153 stop:731 length:579 start_codon:yes stop_codon:yes gene_type:complete